jgi:rhamnulose-1-phosphate aldolase
MSMGGRKLQTITPQNFRDLEKGFHIELPERFLYEKESNEIIPRG